MCTGAPEFLFSHSKGEAVRESNSPRGKASSRFSHSLTPIGERNEFAGPGPWQNGQARKAEERGALTVIKGGERQPC